MAKTTTQTGPRKRLSIATVKANAEKPAEAASNTAEEVAEDPHLSPITALHDETPSARSVMDQVESWFANIGTPLLPETVMPVPPNRNNGQEAAEYAVAEKLAKLAEKRKKAAYEAAAKAGVFGDEDSYKEGDTVTVWQSPYINVAVKMGSPSKMIGKEETHAALEAHLPKGKVADVLEECLKERAATKQIIVSIK